MVHAHNGAGDGHLEGIGVAHLARQWPEAASRRELQSQHDPQFADKLEAIVGLYLHPLEHALVLSVDEKSQIQALDRTQPGLPMKRGRGATMTHDYKRNGTTTLFAALNTAKGEVYGLCQQRHRHQEWLKFLRMINQTVPADKEIDLICDNYSTHKHERVQRWLEAHDGHNQNPKPFIWTAKANDILEKVTRAQNVLNKRRSA